VKGTGMCWQLTASLQPKNYRKPETLHT